MPSQSEKAKIFRALHEAPGTFVIANAWDAGSARMLTALGFKALATSSGACAGVLGRRDGMVTRDEALAHCKAIVDATRSAGVGRSGERLWRRAAKTPPRQSGWPAAIGLVGASIEDATGDPQRPLFDAAHAQDRIAAAVEAARAMPFPFMLTARTENYVRGKTDLDDTIRRLQSFEAAGADVLMAPGLPDLESVRAVCAALSRPVNFMAGIKGKSFTVAALSAGRGEAGQPGDFAVSRRDDRAAERSEGGRRARDLRLPRRHSSQRQPECVHA